MPSLTSHIRRVLPRTVGRYQPVTKFDICTEDALYETFDAFKASLCDQAAQQGFAVRIVWRDSRFGREMVSVTREAV